MNNELKNIFENLNDDQKKRFWEIIEEHRSINVKNIIRYHLDDIEARRISTMLKIHISMIYNTINKIRNEISGISGIYIYFGNDEIKIKEYLYEYMKDINKLIYQKDFPDRLTMELMFNVLIPLSDYNNAINDILNGKDGIKYYNRLKIILENILSVYYNKKDKWDLEYKNHQKYLKLYNDIFQENLESISDDIINNINFIIDDFKLFYKDSRRGDIIKRYYGIYGYDKMSYNAIGKIYNITGSRVRQIHARALMILRHPCRSRFIKTGILSPIYEKDRNLKILKGDELKQYLKSLEDSKNTSDKHKEYLESLQDSKNISDKYKEYLERYPKICFDENGPNLKATLSARSYNALNRVDIDFLDLINLPIEKICKLRNIGIKSAREICSVINRSDELEEYLKIHKRLR